MEELETQAQLETTEALESASSEEALEASQAPAESSQQQGEPDKFQGKSREDIIEMYRNVEKRVGNSVSRERHEELLARIQDLEQRTSSQQAQPTQQAEDPLQLFEREAEEDPKKAIANLVKRAMGQVQEQVKSVSQQTRVQQARDYVESQLRDNPDFKDNWEKMQELDKRYGKYVSPEIHGTKEAVELLYKLARAERMDSYIEKARQSKQAITQEKRSAFSEGNVSSSQGKTEKSPDEMSLEELERVLGRADYY